MQSGYSKQFFARVLFLIWPLLCICIFIIFPGKVSYVQWSNLGEWQLLPGKLLRLDPPRDLVNLLGSFVGVMIFSGSCTSLGIFVTEKLKLDTLSNSRTVLAGLALLTTEFLIGHGLFSLIFLTLGGLYQLTPVSVIVVVSAGFLVGNKYVKNSSLNVFREVQLVFKESIGGRKNKGLVWPSISILFVSILYSSARISYDSSSIYFSDAKLTAMTHHVQFFLDNTFVVSAFQTAIQYSALIQIFGDESARMLSWVFGIIIIIFSLALGEKLGISKQANLILLALLLTSTAFLDLMGDGKVDLMSSAPAIAGIYWMVVESEGKRPNKSLLLLTGLMLGLAIVARPFNAFLMGIYVALFYLQRIYIKNGFEPINFKFFVSSIFWIGVGALGLGIYHLFANWMILGDSFAFMSNISRLSKLDPAKSPWDYYPDQFLFLRLFYPFVATFRNSPPGLGNISPLFVGFLPALFIRDIGKEIKFSKQLKILFFISTITLLVWIFSIFTVFEIRYVLFLWVILFMPLAEIIAGALESEDYFFRNISMALIITLLVFIIIRTLYISLDTYSPIDKNGNPQCYDSRFCEFLRPVNKIASLGDRVLTLNAFRYYLRSDLFACSTKHQEYNILQKLAHENDDAFWSEVYRQGYKYVLYENDYTTRHLQLGIIPNPMNVPDWINLKPLYGKPGDLQIAYEIQAKNPVIDVEFKCLRNASGIWEVKHILQ